MRTTALLATLALATATGAAIADEVPAASNAAVPAGASAGRMNSLSMMNSTASPTPIVVPGSGMP